MHNNSKLGHNNWFWQVLLCIWKGCDSFWDGPLTYSLCSCVIIFFISSFSSWSLQWRFPRAVEPSASLPKEKAYSIAAALPVPCYGSLVDNLSNAGLHGEERIPFSKNEHSAQHVAQQLTLLQQVLTHTTAVCFQVALLSFTSRGRHAC